MDTAELLAGVDEIRWSRMRHAYGPAVEVPGLLRGLADADPANREAALDAMYGGIHHQGDVYSCTIAAIPFLLRIAADTGRPGRAEVVELLGSIGGADDPQPRTGRYAQARAAVAAAYSLWSTLIDDADPQVRAAVTTVLPLVTERAAESVELLRARFAVEESQPVRMAIVAGAAEFARRGVATSELAGWLDHLLNHDHDRQVRLAALVGTVSLPTQPGRPEVAVGTALELLDAVYTGGTATAEPAGFSTRTLVGSLRELRESAAAGRRAPEAEQLVRDVSDGFADRVADRVELLSTLLASPDWERRIDAVYPASNLMTGWRGSFERMVALIGDLLADESRGVARRAVYALGDLGELARPAADALFAGLSRSPRSLDGSEPTDRLPWVVDWPSDRPSVGPALRSLVELRDPRALPMLEWALERAEIPGDAGYLVGRYGESAAQLLPLLRRRLPEQDDRRRDSLVYGIGALGPVAADAVPDLLELPMNGAAIWALTSIGPAAAAAMPRLREQAAAADRSTAVAAADALHAIGGDTSGALAVYDRFLNGDLYDQRAAADGLGRLGPAAEAYAPKLRKLLRRKDSYGWLRLGAARALWRVSGESAATLPVLAEVWQTNAHTRTTIVQVWSEIGPVAADARPLIHAELARVRRHNVSEGAYSSGQVPEDEALLAACHSALAAIT